MAAGKSPVILEELRSEFGVVTAEGVVEFTDEEIARAHAGLVGGQLVTRMVTPWRKG